MADTLPNVDITSEWQAVSVLTDGAIAAGAGCIIQNQSQTRINAAIAASQPAADFMGIIIPTLPERPLMIAAGANEVWLKTRGHGTAIANVQAL